MSGHAETGPHGPPAEARPPVRRRSPGHPPSSIGLRFGLLFAGALIVGACDDEPASQSAADRAVPGQAGAEGSAQPPQASWVAFGDTELPERWLASRDAGVQLDRADRRVAQIGALLQKARQRFRESPRMIVNRAVQLEDMLSGIGIDEPAVELIASLTDAVGTARIEGFGAACQQYFNLRSQNRTREEVLRMLKAIYGGQS